MKQFQQVRVLHRRHMMLSYEDAEYDYSRLSCVEASMAVLAHQADIFNEVQVGVLFSVTNGSFTLLE